MLNKLFLISIVLVLSIPASATTISFEDEGAIITMTPGAVVTLYINATPTPGLMGMDAIISISGGSATITGAMGDPDIVLFPLWDNIADPIYGPDYVEIGGVSFGCNSGTVGYVEITYGSGTVIASLAPGYSWGGSLECDGFTHPTFSDGVVTLVPEPATLFLLALGVTFLRKKR